MTNQVRIAIIGCSHSYYNECDENWTTLFPSNFVIHNYSAAGHGVQHFDFVLKYIIANKLEYDCLIIQLTGTTRWQFPITGHCSDEILINKISDKYVNFAVDYSHATANNVIKFEELYENNGISSFDDISLHTKGLMQSRSIAITDSDFVAHDINISEGNTWVTEYYKLFVDTLHLYEPYFKNVFYWKFSSDVINNIGRDDATALDVVLNSKELYGDLNDIIDDTYHLTPIGYGILFDEYIMKSKIGDYVRSNK